MTYFLRVHGLRTMMNWAEVCAECWVWHSDLAVGQADTRPSVWSNTRNLENFWRNQEARQFRKLAAPRIWGRIARDRPRRCSLEEDWKLCSRLYKHSSVFSILRCGGEAAWKLASHVSYCYPQVFWHTVGGNRYVSITFGDGAIERSEFPRCVTSNSQPTRNKLPVRYPVCFVP